MALIEFPDPERADPDGLVGVGGDLHPLNLMSAYSKGIYPWSTNPVTWWSPDPRAIFELDKFHIGRSLKRFLRQTSFHVTMDAQFQGVIEGCRENRKEGSWIDDEIQDAYIEFHELGYAHSVEVWDENNLVGGVYGIAIKGLFAGESMFSRKTNASKLALVELTKHLNKQGFHFMDIQMLTPVTEYLGAIEIPRKEYLSRLKDALQLNCSF